MIYGHDSETFPISPGMLVPRGVVLSYYCPEEHRNAVSRFAGSDEYHSDRGSLLRFPRAMVWFEERLRAGDTLVAHNQAYDLAVYAAERPEVLPLIFDGLEKGLLRDTMVRGKLIAIARGEHKVMVRDDGKKIKTLFALDAMTKLYTGRVLQKKDTFRVRYHEVADLPLNAWPEEARTYPLDDASAPYEVFQAQEEYVRTSRLFRHAGGKLPNETEQTKIAFVLHLMSVWGISTDGERVRMLRERLVRSLEGSHEYMLEHGLVRQTGPKKAPKWSKDTKAIQSRIEEACARNGKKPMLTDTGKIATSAEAKVHCGDEVMAKMASFASAETLLKSFVPMLERGTTCPINARWNCLVESGRVSVSDPNIANPPTERGVRECYVARPGYAFIDADYRTIELRALAQICYDLFGDSRLRDVFKEGRDPHDELGAQLRGLTPEEAHTHKIRMRTGAVGLDGKPEEVEISLRAFTKMINFGLASGMGEDSFREYARDFGVVLSPAEVHSVRETWFLTWPEVKRYFKWIGSLIPHGGLGTIIQHRSGRVRGGVRFTSAVNTMFQGLTADGAKEGLWLVAKECFLVPSSPLYGSRPVLHMYDENMIETPVDKVTAAATRLRELMIVGMARWLPDVPVETSDPVAMKHWSKDAASELVDGKLTIWDVGQ